MTMAVNSPGRAAQADAEREILRLEGIRKRFPGVLALDGIRLDLRRGEVHAICGENGAGKSTLMKIISGQYLPDEGVIHYCGAPVRFGSAADAQAAGIAIIHQELNLVPHLSVAENLYLAREPRRGPFVDMRRLNADAARCLARIGLDVAPTTRVGALSIAQQQMVEIAKALSHDARVLIMDEPTSSLTESETVQLFRIIEELRADGVAILYISHRLDEMAQIVDRVTVLRDGRHISTDRFADVTIDDIVARMVGRALDDAYPTRQSTPTDEVLLQVDGLRRDRVFGPVSFALRKGEILGFAGLMGAGRTEVARAIFGADRVDGGTISLHGRPVTIRSPREAIRHGIAYLSEDRKKEGLALSMPVAANITLANVRGIASRIGFLRFDDEVDVAQRYVQDLAIRTPSVHQIVRNLSGGNQQKVVIGKWLYRGSKILFFDEPTRGIDVGAKFAIYGLMDRLAADGVGVVLISSELPELLGMTDRIAVFHEGRLTAFLDTQHTSQEEIMHYASGRSHA
ncbi:sugar ABC transporter ATP-binding protein [Burkholderia dolosa]|uniref:sugar ABC transporter ATP-binding protein n=1 Tax=Burkholderia dolosa TaxID=152500 RepID=UPI001B9855CD|nr:sugar ABC transporter ATP-binding protein [Burkholderia dolosa]MBR8057553.1 sugar ABC transporter ATP-binding protein [Burkholderia dolosa]MBR8302836.1 sugar ABC transporter ATP-binding protein [Burkholderia dolosa]MBR8458952.1 sugar ABC transporter ATP-binding protein [Burkholderia dolosa]MBY4831213.1 sugar ABC transporter ATP-binding protein [Burkholderia dolosa]MDN7422475.1 sugar ABC transporter ATP-binding protein [Burkholderia dolosa]